MCAARLGLVAIAWLLAAGCAARTPSPPIPVAADPAARCAHGVACETCVKCHPALAARFAAAGDWCKEHGLPESQCALCNPHVVQPAVPAPAAADIQRLVDAGQDLPSLAAHVAPGKVTLFDFYADWCGPCRQVDEHLFPQLGARRDLALRKLNVVSWETPLAKRHLRGVQSLPYVVVYGRDGKLVGSMAGLHLDQLDALIAKAAL